MDEEYTPGEKNRARVEYGTFTSWEDAATTIVDIFEQQQPTYIAAVSEDEFAGGHYIGVQANDMPLPFLIRLLPKLYPATSIKLFMTEVLMEGGKRIKQLVMVYTKPSKQ